MSQRVTLGALWREGRAWAEQARHLASDWGEVRRAGAGPTVVLVHGVYASPGVFRPLRERLHHDLDATTSSLGYLTGHGVHDLALRLARLIGAEPSPAPIHLVGHSLGGLVVRYYAQELETDARVQSSISLAAPFRGSARTRLVPGQAALDLGVGASVLGRLARGNARGERVPHLSIVAADDLLVENPALPDFGDSLCLPGVGHNGLLFDPRVADALVRRIRLC